MKIAKRAAALMLSVLLIMMNVVSLAADPILTIDDVSVDIDTNGNPCVILNLDGQTFASVRPILEFLDFEVYWQRVDGADRVDAISQGNTLPETADISGIFVDGVQLSPDSNGNPASVINQGGRVFVPIRALLEYLGLDVQWKDGLIIATTPASESALEGTASEILAAIISEADTLLSDENKMPFSFTTTVTEETAQSSLGISPEQFKSNVSEAALSVAGVGTFAHQVALVKCNDEKAAAEVKQWIAAGFDATKWICVFPEQCFVVDSGSYLLMAATTNARAEKLLEAFSTAAKATGEVNAFFGGK